MSPDERDQRAERLSLEADALEEAGSLRDALGKWREVVALKPSAVALSQLGRVATELHEFQEAEQAYLGSISAAPGWSLPYEALAVLYRDRGDLQAAKEYLGRSLALERKARTLTFLGDVLERLGHRSESESALREAIDLDTSYAEAHALLGRALREDPKQAVPHYQRALDLDPDYAFAHRELGWALRRLGHLEEAERHVRTAIALDNTEMWSFVYLGNILWQQGDVERAKEAYEQAIAVDPGDSTGYWCLADLLSAQGRDSAARRMLSQSLRVGIGDPQANLRYGLFLREAGEHRKARRYFRRVLDADAENVVARRALKRLP